MVQEARCGVVVILMAVYWLTEAIPLGITALIPVMALPLLGVLRAKDVAMNYIKVSLQHSHTFK